MVLDARQILNSRDSRVISVFTSKIRLVEIDCRLHFVRSDITAMTNDILYLKTDLSLASILLKNPITYLLAKGRELMRRKSATFEWVAAALVTSLDTGLWISVF